MIWKLFGKYLIGAVILAVVAIGVWVYGNHRESEGYNNRDVKAKIELGKRQTALYEEQMKNEQLRIEADRNVQKLKANTTAVIAARNASDAVVARLREQIRKGISDGGASTSPGGITSTGADWVGGFAACYERYGMLGDDFARTADKLRGLQDFIDPPTK